MSTISVIGIENADRSVDYVYCNWGGQLWTNGAMLMRHYRDEEKVRQLMELKSLSYLGPEIGERVPFDTGTGRAPGWRATQCMSYYRDRGERQNLHTHAASRDEFVKKGNLLVAKNCYLFAGGEWHYLTIRRTYLKPDFGEGFQPLNILVCTCPSHIAEIGRFLEHCVEYNRNVPMRGYGIKEYARTPWVVAESRLNETGLKRVLHDWRETLAADPTLALCGAAELLTLLSNIALPASADARPVAAAAAETAAAA